MRRLASLPALGLLLAACSGGAAPGTPEQACASQANDDPVVKELVMKGAGTMQFQWDNEQRLVLARRDATLRCLRARGLAPKGGVERPRQ
jgi:hypothetical protein